METDPLDALTNDVQIEKAGVVYNRIITVILGHLVDHSLTKYLVSFKFTTLRRDDMQIFGRKSLSSQTGNHENKDYIRKQTQLIPGFIIGFDVFIKVINCVCYHLNLVLTNQV